MNKSHPDAREIFCCQIESHLGARENVIQAVLDAVAAQGFSVDSHFHRLCLDEALINAITHGNASDPGKRVTIRLSCWPKGWTVEITDEGSGFDWRAWKRRFREGLDPGRSSGRGLDLILRSAADVEFLDGGRRLRMSWREDDGSQQPEQ